MTEITPYHRIAELYLTNRISMANMINLAVIYLPPNQMHSQDILFHDNIRDWLVAGIIYHTTLQYQPLRYNDIAKMLNCSVRTIASSAKCLQEKQLIWKLETTSQGTRYGVNKPCIPESLVNLTGAIVDLYFDRQIKAAVAAECLKIKLAGERP